MRVLWRSALAAVAALTLCACGDGGGSTDGSAASSAVLRSASQASAPHVASFAAGVQAPVAYRGLTTSAGATACDTATGRVLQVGPGKPYPVPSKAAAVAKAGDVIKIAAGDYHGDVAAWKAANLTICGDGGRPRLYAAGKYYDGKATWVVSGPNITIDSVEFYDAAVPDGNGAGIRAEHTTGDLKIINVGFFDNENGILQGMTCGATITIDRSEFARSYRHKGAGFTHNLYIGKIAKLTVTNSFFHEATIGHNLKSRAQETRIENSYFMDGPVGTSSYLADFPNGGKVYLRGNMLQKGPKSDNPKAISFGEEGMTWPTNSLEMVHNTVVMKRSGGSFLSVPSGKVTVRLTANLFAGTGNPTLMAGGFASNAIVQKNNLITAASNMAGSDFIASPVFWPTSALIPQITLASVPDPGYVNDAPGPFVVRPLSPGVRYIGALQSKATW